ncbi:MAG TPA: hypothetical protein PK590_07030, partial [Candidatus Omnitrophota bacterium]|nr:hypothetical protein [Candidatus Omnitrophota bacterium]
SDTNQKAETLVNKLVALANQQAKELGFIGEEIKALSASESSNIALIQSKLEEIKTYLLAVKEATDASARGALSQDQEVPSAVVKSWLEMGEGA